MKEKFGVAPEQVVDVLALMGDTIDNIKGVPGIGEKGARELIATYGSLDNLLAHAAEVKHKRYREGLLAQRRRGARRAASWRASAPTCRSSSTPTALRYRGAIARALLRDLQRARLPRARRRSTRRPPTPIAKTYRIVNTADGAARAGRRLRAAGPLRAARAARRRRRRCAPAIVGIAFSTGAARGATTCRSGTAALGDGRSRCRSTPALDALRPVLEDAAIEKVGHDLKFDAIVLARHGVTLRGLDIDTMLASYLLDATRSEHPLEDLALEHTSYKALTEEDVCGTRRQGGVAGRRAGRGGARLRRRARRPRRSARADCSRDAAREGAARQRSTRRSSGR